LAEGRFNLHFLDNGLHFLDNHSGWRVGDRRKVTREVIAGTAIEPHLRAMMRMPSCLISIKSDGQIFAPWLIHFDIMN